MFEFNAYVYLFYFMVIGPFLIYIGFFEKTNKTIFNLLLLFGCIIIIMYGFKLINSINNKDVKVI